jgi:hypothetical protein
MTEDAQTAHCLTMLREWLAAAFPTLSGGGGTVVTGFHIHYREEELQ